MGDNLVLDIVGRGSIRVKFSNGRIRIFDVVLHIQRLARNFLSVSKLIDAGVHVHFSEAGVKIVRGENLVNMVIERGSSWGTLYQLDACTIECNNTFDKIVMRTNFLDKERVSLLADGHGF